MQPKARTTTAIKTHSTGDRQVIAADAGGAREADWGHGVGIVISVAHLARLACLFDAPDRPEARWPPGPPLRLHLDSSGEGPRRVEAAIRDLRGQALRRTERLDL
jgi:hypothetical protein